MPETPALSFTRSIDSPLTFCFQHFRIYIEVVRTSTRGLWTPIKLYFVQSSKWSDHKPSNRGINSQYWPDFQLRPAPMASFQNFEDRLLAQTFARLEKVNEARRLFLFYKCEQKKCWRHFQVYHWFRRFGWLPWSQHQTFTGMFRVNRGSRKSIPCGISHVFVSDKNLFWMHGVVDTFILTD